MDYEAEVKKAVIEFLTDFDNDFKQAIIDGKGFNEDEIKILGNDFQETIVNRTYIADDAVYILKHTVHEETNSKLWEGKNWEAQLIARAAYSFYNDVWFKAKELYNEVKAKYAGRQENEEEIDPIWSKYFDQFNPKELHRDSKEELKYLKEWFRNSIIIPSHLLGKAYLDLKYGAGYGVPDIKDFVDHDNLAPWLVPYDVGMLRSDVRDRIEQLELRSGTTTIQLSRSTKHELDELKRDKDNSYEDVIQMLLHPSKDVREI